MINQNIPGVSEVIIPENAGVANAIGASIAQIGGEIDRVYSYAELGRDTAISTATEQAKQSAINAGADPSSLEVVKLEELPIPYLPGEAVRLKVKVAGQLDIGALK